MKIVDKSRDLSQQFGGGRLDIEIIGIGTSYTKSEGLASLSDHVSLAFLFLTGREIVVKNPKKAPWYLVSFDRDACKLVVKPVGL